MELRRTVPFLCGTDLLVDTVKVAPGGVPGPAFVARLAQTLDLGDVAEVLPASLAIEIVQDQYDVCLDFVFSHQIWSLFRQGSGRQALLAYLLETRHYLAAASSRMAPGVASAVGDDRMTELLALHLIEEADHARFFDEALATLGCDSTRLDSVRPDQRTVEWIHLMRTLGASDPLCAALVSGLMESSAKDRTAVLGWHDMLERTGLLPAPTVTAFKRHVLEDHDLGHGGLWRQAIQLEGAIATARLARGLNAVTIAAEMLFRWFDGLVNGLSGVTVELLAAGAVPAAMQSTTSPFLSGAPVWPASVLESVSYSAELPTGARETLARCYHLAHDESHVDEVNRGTVRALLSTAWGEREALTVADVDGWMRTIDGHSLWQEMLACEDRTLAQGWVLENVHYLRASTHHTSAALASCGDPWVRAWLVEHLAEERDHAALIVRGLDLDKAIDVARLRPLPTTVAFVGALGQLAQQDWRAYCLAVAFLQLSLKPDSERHSAFYRAIEDAVPAAGQVLSGVRRHDEVDGALGHQEDVARLLERLLRAGPPSRETIARATSIPMLAWSFLDGIRAHYSRTGSSIVQRLGWVGARRRHDPV